jgi:hypothetical protein
MYRISTALLPSLQSRRFTMAMFGFAVRHLQSVAVFSTTMSLSPLLGSHRFHRGRLPSPVL